LDHFHFEDLTLIPILSTESCIYIAPGINITNITIDGTNVFSLGKHGIYWDDKDLQPQAASLNLNFQNIRREQTQDSQGYTIFLNHNIQNVLLQNIFADGSGKGFYFRNNKCLTLQNCFYPGTGESFNADGSCSDIVLQNTFLQKNTFLQNPSTMQTDGLEEVFSLQKFAGSSSNTIYFDTLSNADKRVKIYGISTFRNSGTLPVNGTYTIPFNGIHKVAIVNIAAYSNSGSNNEGGLWMVTSNSVKLISGTANTAVGNIADKLCVFYESINSIHIINNLFEPVTYVLTMDWTT
jgi:hypothetical protein